MSAGILLIRKFSARLNTLENARYGTRNILKKTNTGQEIWNKHAEKNTSMASGTYACRR
jgi:hypothetical protein